MKIKSILIAIHLGLFITACNNGGTSTYSTNTSSVANTGILSNNKTTNSLTSNTNYPINLVGYKINSSYEESGTIYAGTENGLFISNKSGTDWDLKTQNNGLTSNNIKKVSGFGQNIYVIADSYLNASFDGGNTWKVITPSGTTYNHYYSISTSGNTIYVGADSGIYSSNDNGSTWHYINTNNAPANIIYVNGSTIYFISKTSSRDGLYISKDNGVSWTIKYGSTLSGNILTDIVASGNNMYVSGESGVAVSTDGGNKFTLYTTSNGLGSKNVKALSIDENGKLLAATSNGMSISTNQGKIFTNYLPDHNNQLVESSINSVFSNNEVILIGTEQGLTKYNNKYTFSWDLITGDPATSIAGGYMNKVYYTSYSILYEDPVHIPFACYSCITPFIYSQFYYEGGNSINNPRANAVAVDNESSIYVGTITGVSVSHDDGRSWKSKGASNGLPVTYITSMSATNNDVYAGTYDGIAISHNKGDSWTQSLSNYIIYGVYANGSTIYAGSYQNGLYLSHDKGNTWDYLLVTDPLDTTTTNRTIRGVFAIGKTIYAAVNDGLYISYDEGKNWSHKTNGISGLAVTSVYVSADNIYLGLSNGDVALSLNGGNSFYRYSSYTINPYYGALISFAVYEHNGEFDVALDNGYATGK